MSILLYALGGALFVWSALMLLSGETFATIDIAAGLAGWGAFTIGLGALTAAVERLNGTIAGRGPASAAVPGKVAPRLDTAPDVLPVFVPRGADPAHFEPALVADRQKEPRPDRAPLEPTVVADVATASEIVGDEPDPDKDDAALNKKERRARKLLARRQAAVGAEEPTVAVGEAPVAAAELTSATSPSGGSKRPDRDARRGTVGDETADASAERRLAGDMFVRARPLTPGRPEQPSPLQPILAASPAVAPPRDGSPEFTDDEPTIGTPADRASPGAADGATPGPSPQADPDRSPHLGGASAGAKDVGVAPEPTPVAPEPEPEPRAPRSGSSEPLVSAREDPKVPEWLARARARREARGRAEVDASGAGAEAMTPAPAPVFRPDPEVAPPAPVAPPAVSVDPPSEPAPPPTLADEPEASAPVEDAPLFSAADDIPAPAVADELAPPLEADEAVEPKVVSEGEHNGVVYRFFDDGSVEAASRSGVRRFASVDDLRATVRNARGQDDAEAPLDEPAPDEGPEVEPAPVSEPETAPAPEPKRPAELDPLDAALAELEREPSAAPELRIDPDDRPGPRGAW